MGFKATLQRLPLPLKQWLNVFRLEAPLGEGQLLALPHLSRADKEQDRSLGCKEHRKPRGRRV